MSDKKRTYRKTRRAELEEQTRRRITQSAVELHGSLGPARSTISALAQHAGVRRSTVYRHFPDEDALFAACSSYWLAKNPFPDIVGWGAIKDADERLSRALRELYNHYRRNERMITNILRDEATVPILTRTLAGYRQYLAGAREALMAGRVVSGLASERVHAAIGHSVAFYTWRSLAMDQGLDDEQASLLMSLLVHTAGSTALAGC